MSTPIAAMRALRQRAMSSSARASGKIIAVTLLVALDDVVPREASARIERGGVAHVLPAIRVGENADRAGSHRLDVADGTEHAGDSLLHDLDESARARAHHGDARGERLERAEPEGLDLCREEKEVGFGEQGSDDVDLAEEMDVPLD